MITKANIATADAAASGELVNSLICRESWSRDRLLTYQHDRLHALLEHAVSSSSFYREVSGADALDPTVRLEDRHHCTSHRSSFRRWARSATVAPV